MKILCLHGNGMSGKLFEVQTAAFRRLLGDGHEYTFLDGLLESSCVIGLEKVSSGPYFRWNVELTSAEILAAQEYIQAVIEDEGPFDGVMGFSQGSALLASILLQHEIDSHKKPPPFRFAILFSCFLVVSSDSTFAQKYYEIGAKDHVDSALQGLHAGESSGDTTATTEGVGKTEEKKKEVKAPTHKVELIRKSKRAALVEEIVDAVASSARTGAKFHGSVGHHIPEDASGGLDGFPRIYHPAIMSERIQIPTAHIVGRNDPFLKQTAIAKKLWEKKNMRYVEHAGEHDTPRSAMDVKAAVAAAQWAIQQAETSQSRWHFHK
ncbi:serine hydrolase FSH [Halenospora varia]|nr:serine hydrolase FSH [Halenospora varia]